MLVLDYKKFHPQSIHVRKTQVLGSYALSEKLKLGGIGIGGMKYLMGLDHLASTGLTEGMVGSFEICPKGMAVYLNSGDSRFLLLANWSEFSEFKVYKEPDLIFRRNKGLFHFFINKTNSYRFSKIWLMEEEILKETKILIDLGFQDLEKPISFEVKSLNVDRWKDFVLKCPIAHKIDVNYFEYTI